MHPLGLNIDKPCGVSAPMMEMTFRQSQSKRKIETLIDERCTLFWAALVFFFYLYLEQRLTSLPPQHGVHRCPGSLMTDFGVTDPLKLSAKRC